MRSLKVKAFQAVPGKHYGTPRELWGFRTTPVPDSPVRTAHRFLKANAELLGLQNVRLRRMRVIHSVGAQHIIFQQHMEGLRIHRAYVTVHVARDGRVYL